VTVACTGAWSDRLLQRSAASAPELVRASKGVHIVLPALPTTDALLLVSDVPGRVLFVLPWYGRSVVGTTDTDYTADPDRVRAEPEEIDDLLALANRALDGVSWTRNDVVGSFAGLRALPTGSASSTADVTRRIRIASPMKRLLVPVGGKYTSARSDADRIVRRVEELLGREPARCPTLDRPFPWRPDGDLGAWQAAALARGTRAGLDEETAAGCALRYGTTVDRLFDAIESSPDLARRILADQPFCFGEVVHAVEHEMARDLVDILRRRLPLLLVSRPDRAAYRRAAQLAGERLDWSPARVDTELASVTEERAPGEDRGGR
jgi:glycerol-3-phosphate dehydrogenase